MKRASFIPALFLLIAAAVFPSCERREENRTGSGRAVSFSSSSLFPLRTKTAYNGGDVADGKYERINWVSGDKISILSPDAVRYNETSNPWTLNPSGSNPTYYSADYSVSQAGTPSGTGALSGVFSKAPVVPAEDESLRWGEEGTHHFFGVYPAKAFMPDDVQSYMDFTLSTDKSTGIIQAYLPGNQPYSGTGTEGNITLFKPDMKYAWMASAQIAPEAESEVTMFFSPIITTFQVTIGGSDSEEIAVSSVQLYSERTSALHGSYYAYVTATGVVTEQNVHGSPMPITYGGIPDSITEGVNDRITVSLPAGTVVSSSKKIRVTVFAFPEGPGGSSSLDGLSLRVVSGGITRSLKLMDAAKNNWVQFPAGKKINIDGITLPRQDKPWTFTVVGTDLLPEISDIAVSPVAVEAFTEEDMPTPLDEMSSSLHITPAASSVWVGDEVTLTAYMLTAGFYTKVVPDAWTLSSGAEAYVTRVSEDGSSITLKGISATGSAGPVTVSATRGELSASARVAVTAPVQSRAFSVAATRYVYFAPGNLQYVFGTDASEDRSASVGESCTNGEWRFAPKQYSFYGPQANADAYTSKQVGSVIDLFSYGSSGFNYEDGRVYKPWAYDVTVYNDYYGPSSGGLTLSGKSDWAAQTIQGADPQIEWRTPAIDELEYMSAISNITRPGGEILFGSARVAGIKGVVLLPDDWVLPAGFTDFVPGLNEESETNYMVVNNNYTADEWELLEAAGAIFLPTTGIITRRSEYPSPAEYVLLDLQHATSKDYLFYRTTGPTAVWGWHGRPRMRALPTGGYYSQYYHAFNRAVKLPVRLVRDAGDVTHGLAVGLISYALNFSLADPSMGTSAPIVRYDASDVTPQAQITWTCSDPSVVKMIRRQDKPWEIDVVPLKKGKADLTCTIKYGNQTRTLVCKALVQD